MNGYDVCLTDSHAAVAPTGASVSRPCRVAGPSGIFTRETNRPTKWGWAQHFGDLEPIRSGQRPPPYTRVATPVVTPTSVWSPAPAPRPLHFRDGLGSPGTDFLLLKAPSRALQSCASRTRTLKVRSARPAPSRRALGLQGRRQAPDMTFGASSATATSGRSAASVFPLKSGACSCLQLGGPQPFPWTCSLKKCFRWSPGACRFS